VSKPVDARGVLDDAPFTFTASGDGKVFIRWKGRQAAVLQGERAKQFLTRIQGADGKAAQLLMAKATGNFKRGNEKSNRK